MPSKTEKFIDLVDRDPNNINQFIQCEFDDILAESDSPRSVDCIWVTVFRCFICSRNLGYKLLTYPFSVILALMWGCIFGSTTFNSIWIVTPSIRMLTIISNPIRLILTNLLQLFCGPLVETCGMFFSRINVVNSKSEPPKKLDMW